MQTNNLFDLSICIVNHKHRDLLAGCLESIFSTTPSELRIRVVVVDNHSCDGSVQMLQKRFPQVNLIENQTQLGFAVNQNRMLEQEMKVSRYVMMLNDDTLILSDCIEQLFDFAEHNNKLGAVAPQLLWPDGRLQISASAFPTVWKELWRYSGINRFLRNDKLKSILARVFTRWGTQQIREYFKSWAGSEPRQSQALCGGALMFRSKTLEEIGILDETYFMYMEDIDWCYRANRAGWECWLIPNARIVHFGGSSGSTRTQIEWERSTLYYYSKFKTRQELILLRIGLTILSLVKMFFSPLFWLTGNKSKFNSELVVNQAIISLCLAG